MPRRFGAPNVTTAASRPPHPSRADAQVRRWIARQIAQDPPRAPSLIVTVWGDAIAPHGGTVALAGLIRLLAPFGINERLVRTSVFRLARQGWLDARRVGRRSLYALTPDGARRFAEAHRRIYAAGDEPWDGTWEIVVADGLSPAERRVLAAELRWAGYGGIGTAVQLRPARPDSPLASILRALRCEQRVVVARATEDAEAGGRSLASCVSRAWDLAEIAAAYRDFLQRFGTVIERFRGEGTRDPAQCFIARTLLVHAWRRALLRDPRLPAALLPLDWPGAAAFALCRDFYRLTRRAADRHLQETLGGAAGPLPAPATAYHERFGGLAEP
jgi:phenylacetic acid degradation operon negative regulatory protein